MPPPPLPARSHGFPDLQAGLTVLLRLHGAILGERGTLYGKPVRAQRGDYAATVCDTPRRQDLHEAVVPRRCVAVTIPSSPYMRNGMVEPNLRHSYAGTDSAATDLRLTTDDKS
jgi:hypothetical protein